MLHDTVTGCKPRRRQPHFLHREEFQPHRTAPNRDRLFIKPNDTRPQRIRRIVLIGVHAQIGREQKDSVRHDPGQGPAKAGHTRVAVRYATATENGVITGHLGHSQFGS